MDLANQVAEAQTRFDAYKRTGRPMPEVTATLRAAQAALKDREATISHPDWGSY